MMQENIIRDEVERLKHWFIDIAKLSEEEKKQYIMGYDHCAASLYPLMNEILRQRDMYIDNTPNPEYFKTALNQVLITLLKSRK